MYKKYALDKLKMDFAGYFIKNPSQISFHHLIVSHKECKNRGLGEGYWEWNGALLVQHTSHDYLHQIQNYDEDRFLDITSEMIDENIKGYLDMDNIRVIDDIMESFEREYCNTTTKKGYPIIKPEYVRERVLRKNNFR